MNKLLKLLIISPLLITILYCGAWFYFAQELKKGINQFYETDGPKQGYIFYGDKPTISGFPLKPSITYKKGFAKDNLNVQFKELKITGIPLASQSLDIKVDTLAIQNSAAGQLYEIDNLKGILIIPKYLPDQLTRPKLQAWQEAVEVIKINSLELNKNKMYVKAHGYIGLDKNLQPTLSLNTLTTDYDELIRFMTVETSELKPLTANIALTVLNSLAKTDEATGDKFVRLDIKIQKQRLIVGPIKTLIIPKITWPEDL